jgi:hypothetical protein
VSDETRHETQLERLDRNFEELTGELRVVVTGVQVLFAFLLIVPFNSGFVHVGDFERAVYFLTLVLAALAAVCTIAPSAEHRFLVVRATPQEVEAARSVPSAPDRARGLCSMSFTNPSLCSSPERDPGRS